MMLAALPGPCCSEPAKSQPVSITASHGDAHPSAQTLAQPSIGAEDVAIFVDPIDQDLPNMQHPSGAGQSAKDGDNMKTVTALAVQMADTMKTNTHKCKDIGNKITHLGTNIFQVREWVKCGTGEVYVNVLDSLEVLMSERTTFVIALADASRLLGDYELQASMLFKRILSRYDGSLMDKWNAKHFERELASLDDMYQSLQTHQEALQALSTQRQRMPSLDGMILKLDRHLHVSDSSAQIRAALERYSEHEKVQDQVFRSAANKEAQIGISEATIEYLNSRIQEEESRNHQLASDKACIEKQVSELKHEQDVTFEEHREGLKKLKEDTERQRNDLRKQKEHNLLLRDKQSEDQTIKFNATVRALEDKLMAAGVDEECNHIIFLLDISWSMSGTRWSNTVSAVESFLSVRVQQGSQDKVSIICFNTQAEVFISNHDIGYNFIDQLRTKVSLGGGTAYAPAWIKVQDCVDQGPPGSRLFVVQVTDGLSSDIQDAASHAKQLFDRQAGLNHPMLTLLVNIDCTVEQKVLQPLVKAANGGRLTLKLRGQQVPLFCSMRSGDMVQQFRLLATLPLSVSDQLKCQISRVREMERQERENVRQNLEVINSMFDTKLKSLEARARELAKVIEEDSTVVAQKHIMEKERERLQEELDNVSLLLDNSQERLCRWKESRSKEDANLKSMREAVKDCAENIEAVKTQLNEQQKVNVEELKGIVNGSKQQLERLGTTDASSVIEHISQLKQMLVHHNQYRMLLQHAAGAIGSLQRFTKHFTASVREPLSDIQDSLASKANFVFKLLLEDRALFYQAESGQQMASSGNLKVYLRFEARAMGVKEDDLDDVVHMVLASNIEAEDLCAACGALDEDVDTLKNEVVEKLEKHVLQCAGVDKAVAPKKVKDMKDQVKSKKKEIASLQAKKKKTTEEDEVEALEDQIEQAESEMSTLQEDIESAEESMKDKQKALAEAASSRKLVERAFGQCLLTYVRQCEKERLREIESIFGDLYKSVVTSIRDFRGFTDHQQQALNDFATTNLPKAPAGGYPATPAIST